MTLSRPHWGAVPLLLLILLVLIPSVPFTAFGSDDEVAMASPYYLVFFIGEIGIWMGDEIRYSVPETSVVEARMLTVSGEIIVLLQMGEQSPGQYTLPWHGLAHRAPMAGLYTFELYFGDEYAAQFQIAVVPEGSSPAP